MKEALRLSGHVTIGQVLGSNADTIVKNQGGPAAVRRDGGRDGVAVVDAIVAKTPVVTHTPAALSAHQQAAAPTAIAATATQTATVTTAPRVADGGANVHQTLNMSGEEAEVVDDPGDISTPRPPQKTPAHVHAATVAGRGTDGTTGAAQEALVAGAAAPAPDPGGAATAAATAPPAAPPAPPKALLAGEVPGVERTVTRGAETLTAPASIAPSLHVHLHHEALTATHIHPARRL